MIHAPSGIAQAEANVRVGGHTSEMQLWIHGRPNRQRNGDVRWALGRHWAIEPHWPWQREAVTSTLAVRAAAHTRSSFVPRIRRPQHRGFVLFGAVTCACIQRASGIRGLWLGARTEPAVLCGAASAAQYGQNGMLMLTSFFFALWRWRRWQTIEKPGVESVASTAIDELNSGLGC